MKTYPLISVVIPFRNEQKHIKECIESLLEGGGYPKDKLEFILVDGNSTDDSKDIIRDIDISPATINIVHNPKQTVPCAMNLGIAASKGDIILWAGAHSIYLPNYIWFSVTLLIEKNAASVGGVIIPKGFSRAGRAIAIAASNPFGVGNAKYRYTDKAGWVDTVFGGCFRKRDILSIGGFNENWTVNQDGELNFRLRDQIGKIYLSPEIRSEYFVRESYLALAKQYFRYGKWRTKTLMQHLASFTLRQAAAPLFVVALMACLRYASVSLIPFLLLLLIYSTTGYLFIHKQLKRPIGVVNTLIFIVKALLVLAAFMTMHISWGLGFIIGLPLAVGQKVMRLFK